MERPVHNPLQDTLNEGFAQFVAGQQQLVGSLKAPNPVLVVTPTRTLHGALDSFYLSFVESTRIENDFCGWLADQVKVLHSRQYNRLDWDNLAEELEAMGVSQRSELKSRLHTLLLHLLKWQTQSNEREQRARSWMQTIREQRRKITDLLKLSPSLKHYLPDLLAEAWEWACEDALDDSPGHSFPATCPWAYDLFMARDFLSPDLPVTS
ncbi:MAG: DUF29 domain-containing protein [Candidatus Binatus sp.]|uniref:DUF29 domain-containing protein n=1 Tax=Candidatus Binatus sp. TaxID=2811406 RepID=UPI002726749A|nr:DUF29 domain-containing protein [Candidatus Binatus sp.]MDO8433251.1 DUF29 domain-containing protein [Candidatus Binatus sp.]